MVQELDAALAHFAAVVRRDLGVEVADIPGSGAAGGLGAGLLAFAAATLVPGAQLVLETLDFPAVLQQADLVITAEGQLDAQTAYGKAVAAVAASGRMAGAAIVALAGRVASAPSELDRLGIDVALPIAGGPMTLEESMARAAELLETAAARAMRLVAVGERLASHRTFAVTDPPEHGP
jgi:glycerate kinase